MNEIGVRYVVNQIQQKLFPDLNFPKKLSLHKSVFLGQNTCEQYFKKYKNYTYSKNNKYYTRDITNSENDLKLR